MTSLAFAVHGLPAPQGSKRHVGNGVMVESSKRVRPWRQDVKYAALEALAIACPDCASGGAGHFPRGEAVAVRVDYLLPRPKGHYRTGANAHLLREGAPKWPTSKPDVDKLLRSTLDALGEAGVWHDDSQVVSVEMGKHYADALSVGARIVIREVTP